MLKTKGLASGKNNNDKYNDNNNMPAHNDNSTSNRYLTITQTITRGCTHSQHYGRCHSVGLTVQICSVTASVQCWQ